MRGALDLAVLDDASVTAGREFQSAFLRVFEIDGEPFQTVDPTIDLSTGFVDLGAEADPIAAAHAWMTRDYTAPLDPHGIGWRHRRCYESVTITTCGTAEFTISRWTVTGR